MGSSRKCAANSASKKARADSRPPRCPARWFHLIIWSPWRLRSGHRRRVRSTRSSRPRSRCATRRRGDPRPQPGVQQIHEHHGREREDRGLQCRDQHDQHHRLPREEQREDDQAERRDPRPVPRQVGPSPGPRGNDPNRRAQGSGLAVDKADDRRGEDRQGGDGEDVERWGPAAAVNIRESTAVVSSRQAPAGRHPDRPCPA